MAPDRARPVLLVEDDEDLRRILARHLRTHGLPVREASTCEAAIAELGDGLRPAVVVLDVNLPGNTGWNLLRGRALANAGSPPVVITSAISISPRRLEEFGVAGYLPKPFPLETLMATIERLTTDEAVADETAAEAATGGPTGNLGGPAEPADSAVRGSPDA